MGRAWIWSRGWQDYSHYCAGRPFSIFLDPLVIGEDETNGYVARRHSLLESGQCFDRVLTVDGEE